MISQTDKEFFKLAIPGPYKESDLDIAAKCPICGDSKHKRSSKRLHLFHKENKTAVRCFNGGCEAENPSSLFYFFKRFYPDIFEQYKRETYRHKIETEIKPQMNFEMSLDDFGTDDAQISENMQISTRVEICETSELAQNVNYGYQNFLVTLTQNISSLNEKTKQFLLSRGLNAEKLQNVFGKFYSGTSNFMFEGKNFSIRNTLFIPILGRSGNTTRVENPGSNEIVGFYARDINEKRFVNHNRLKGPFTPWNFNRVDLSKRVFIFEAILDALSFYEIYNEENVVALCTNNINPLILERIEYPVFCLDNDEVGIRTMLKYINTKNAEFLIYNTKSKDFNEMLLRGEKMKLEFESGFRANIALRKLIA